MSHHCLNYAARKAPVSRFPAARPLALAVHLIVYGGVFALSGGSPEALAQDTATTQTSCSYDIPAGLLNSVLMRFSREAGVFLVGAGDTAEGKTSPGLKGSYSVPDGFAALLAGTGLEAFRQADGSYGLRAAPVGEPSAETTLSAVTVTAGSDVGYFAPTEQEWACLGIAQSLFRCEL